MKLSAKARYGLKVMCYLAKHQGEGPISLPSIASEIDASEKYTEQIILALRKADLVQATRGMSAIHRLSYVTHTRSPHVLIKVGSECYAQDTQPPSWA